MSKQGPILIIEDDTDDKKLLEDALKDIGYSNRIVWYDNTEEAYNYLDTTNDSIFVIFSDINLPGKNGLDFKKKVDSVPHLRQKSIPFVFYSTSANQKDINEAYTQMTVQGFFKKGRTYEEAKNTLKLILEYWKECRHPNTQ
jgi:response regulator RpfG family c-di-GMP phosphodiesterase